MGDQVSEGGEDYADFRFRDGCQDTVDLLFVDGRIGFREGQPNLLHAFTKACEEAGVGGAFAHTVRHVATSLTIADDADIAAVSRFLGQAR